LKSNEESSMKNRALFKNNSKVSFWKKSIGSQPSNKSYNSNSKIFGISPWVKDLPMTQMSCRNQLRHLELVYFHQLCHGKQVEDNFMNNQHYTYIYYLGIHIQLSPHC